MLVVLALLAGGGTPADGWLVEAANLGLDLLRWLVPVHGGRRRA